MMGIVSLGLDKISLKVFCGLKVVSYPKRGENPPYKFQLTLYVRNGDSSFFWSLEIAGFGFGVDCLWNLLMKVIDTYSFVEPKR